METAQPLPAYYRLKRRLLTDIEAGHYGMDGRLPTEHELCAAYGLLAAFSILYSLPVVALYSVAQRTLGNAFALSGAVEG